jgi:hypothetical protein
MLVRALADWGFDTDGDDQCGSVVYMPGALRGLVIRIVG